jgi:hypothetical protein
MYSNTSHVFYQLKHSFFAKRNFQVFDELSNDKRSLSRRQIYFESEKKERTKRKKGKRE